jgi:tetratricopeptide (TPR) repeat protein
MSLLLQALQKAAKTREDGETAGAAGAGVNDELELEPLQAEPTLIEELGAPDIPPTQASQGARAQAATVMQAGRAAPGFDPVDYAREHYMITFMALAVLFVIGYGGYVYIQIARPFGSSAPVPVAPVAQAPAAAPAQQTAQAKVSGMPATDAPAPVTTGQPMATSQALAPAAERPAASLPGPTREPSRALATDAQQAAQSGGAEPASGRGKTSAITARPKADTGMTRARPNEPLADASDSVETIVIRPPVQPGKEIAVRMEGPAGAISPVLLQAYQALQNGEENRARELYQQVLQVEPRNVDALLGLGAIAWKQGRADEASQHYQRVLELEPRNAYAQAGLIAIVGGADPQASESRLKQLIAREPSAFLHFTLGNLYAEQGQWPAAQQAYFQAYQMQSDNADYAFNVAVGLEHLGQNRPALDYYRKALDLSFRKGRANFDQNLVIQRVGQLSSRVDQ